MKYFIAKILARHGDFEHNDKIIVKAKDSIEAAEKAFNVINDNWYAHRDESQEEGYVSYYGGEVAMSVRGVVEISEATAKELSDSNIINIYS